MFRHLLAASAAAMVLVVATPVCALDGIEADDASPHSAQSPVTPDVQNAQSAPFLPPLPMPAAVASAVGAVAAAFEGMVSFYGNEFAGRKTANGERFDPNLLTMAHRTLPFGTLVRITNLTNNKSVVARVNDRGPFIGGRVGDLSTAAAAMIDMVRSGVARARLEVLGPPPAAR